MKFIDYKCKDCNKVSEVVIRGDNHSAVKCEKCGSKKMVKIFAPVGFKKEQSSNSSNGSSCSSCSGGNCASCSG